MAPSESSSQDSLWKRVSCRLMVLFFLQGPCWGETSTVLTEPAPALSVSKAALLPGGAPGSACSVASGVPGTERDLD